MKQLRSTASSEGYSYKPFDQFHCIFIHIPKAAGVSVAKTLFGNLGGGHTSIRDYQIIFPKKKFDHYFKFTFVRNPWDRVFSAYHFLRKGGMDEADRKFSQEMIAPYDDFEIFIRKGLFKRKVKNYVHFKPQFQFLCTPDSEKLQIDFLGFFENINEDFDFVKSKLSFDDNTTLKHENKTKTNGMLDYRNYYTDETRNMVADLYRKDIEFFNYNFDNSSLETQLKMRSTGSMNCKY